MSKFRHRIVLANSIESRDGTMNADSKMKNMVTESVEGELVAVKRPGITSDVELPPGLAQGLFSLNGLAYAIVDDSMFEFSTAVTGGGTGGSEETNSGWIQVPGAMPFTLEPHMFAGAINGAIFAIGWVNNDEGGISYYCYSSVDGLSWMMSGYNGSALGYSGKTLLKDGVILGFHNNATSWNKLWFGKSSDGDAWQSKEIPTPFDVEISQQLMSKYFMEGIMVVHGGLLLAFIKWRNSVWHVCSSVDGEVLSNSTQTNLFLSEYIKKIISHNGDLYAIGGIGWSRFWKSSDNGVTWSVFSGIGADLIDCVSADDGILVLTANNETWIIDDQGIVTKKNYTLPDSPMKNGHLLAVGPDFFMIGCGDSYNTVFKLVDSSGPVGTPL